VKPVGADDADPLLGDAYGEEPLEDLPDHLRPGVAKHQGDGKAGVVEGYGDAALRAQLFLQGFRAEWAVERGSEFGVEVGQGRKRFVRVHKPRMSREPPYANIVAEKDDLLDGPSHHPRPLPA